MEKSDGENWIYNNSLVIINDHNGLGDFIGNLGVGEKKYKMSCDDKKCIIIHK